MGKQIYVSEETQDRLLRIRAMVCLDTGKKQPTYDDVIKSALDKAYGADSKPIQG